jgi:hypothetical protein
LTLDSINGTLSGTPAGSRAGSYPLLINASNGIPPDAVKGTTLTVLPASSLSIVVTSPAAGAGPCVTTARMASDIVEPVIFAHTD